MIYELIYTSAPKGLKPGSRGFCTVARTAGFPASLDQALESMSGYRWLEARAQQPLVQPVNILCSQVQAGGRTYRVLSRIGDAGADYSGRTNKCAHHFAMADGGDLPPGGPAWAALEPGLFETQWQGEPVEFPPNRKQFRAAVRPSKPATAWQELPGGDAGWAGVIAQRLFDQPATQIGLIFNAGQPTLNLVDDVLALLPSEKRWTTTFSTYLTDRPTALCNIQCILPDSTLLTDLRRNPQAWILDVSGSGVKVIKGEASLTDAHAEARIGWARAGAPASLTAAAAARPAEAAKSGAAAKKVVISAATPAKVVVQAAAVAAPSIDPAMVPHAIHGPSKAQATPLVAEKSKGVPWVPLVIMGAAFLCAGVGIYCLINQAKAIPQIDVPGETISKGIVDSPEIATTMLPAGRIGEFYKCSIELGDHQFAKISVESELPKGLTLEGAVLRGTPLEHFDGQVRFRATRENLESSRVLKLRIRAKLPIAIADPAFEEIAGTPFKHSLALAEANQTYEPAGSMPDTLTLEKSGVLKGTLSNVGKTVLNYSIKNEDGEAAQGVISINVNPPKIDNSRLPQVEITPQLVVEAKTETKKIDEWLNLDMPLKNPEIVSSGDGMAGHKLTLRNVKGTEDYELLERENNLLTISLDQERIRISKQNSIDNDVASILKSDFLLKISPPRGSDRPILELGLQYRDNVWSLYQKCKISPIGKCQIPKDSSELVYSPVGASKRYTLNISKKSGWTLNRNISKHLGLDMEIKSEPVLSLSISEGTLTSSVVEKNSTDNIASIEIGVINANGSLVAKVVFVDSIDIEVEKIKSKVAEKDLRRQEIDDQLVKISVPLLVKDINTKFESYRRKLAEASLKFQNYDVVPAEKAKFDAFVNDETNSLKCAKVALINALNSFINTNKLEKELIVERVKLMAPMVSFNSDAAQFEFNGK